MKIKVLLGAAFAVLALGGLALAQSIVVPQVSIINPGDLFQDVVNGAPQVGNVYASEALMQATWGIGAASRGNALIGGDATTNLWQRGTTGSSVTTTVTYGGPDRWAYWSGASTAMTVSRSNTAAALPTGYEYAFRMQRTASQTGVVQMCMAQEVESVNSYQFAGSTAELDFHAYTGANFSAANANMTAYIIYGTGPDEGITNLAFGLNAGGGGSSGWTGQTNATAAVISLGGVSTAGRYAAIASIPSTATEIAVALCYTPTGTAGTTDAVYFSGIQLVRNAANASFANPTAGYNDASTTNFTAAAFERRQQAVETALQERYYWTFTEPTTAASVIATGVSLTTATCALDIPLPVTMRVAPTYSNALTASTFGIISGAGEVALSTPFSATKGVNLPALASVVFTTGATQTQWDACQLVSVTSGTGVMAWSAEL